MGTSLDLRDCEDGPEACTPKGGSPISPVQTPRGQSVICAVVYIDGHTYVLYTYMFCAVC